MNRLTVKQEVALLRSAIIGLVGKDREGEYRPNFIAEVFRDVRRKPTKKFSTKEDFLSELEAQK